MQAVATKVETGDWSITFKESLNTSAAPSVVSTVNDHQRLSSKAVRDLLIVVQYAIGT